MKLLREKMMASAAALNLHLHPKQWVAFETVATEILTEISHLWRQKAPQPAHALDFAYLVGDALFELLV